MAGMSGILGARRVTPCCSDSGKHKRLQIVWVFLKFDVYQSLLLCVFNDCCCGLNVKSCSMVKTVM